MPIFSILYLLLIISLVIAGIIADRKHGIAKHWLMLDFFSGIIKSCFIIHFYYDFLNLIVIVPLILVSLSGDISSYIRDYERVKEYSIPLFIFSYSVSTLLLLPPYIFVILAILNG